MLILMIAELDQSAGRSVPKAHNTPLGASPRTAWRTTDGPQLYSDVAPMSVSPVWCIYPQYIVKIHSLTLSSDEPVATQYR